MHLEKQTIQYSHPRNFLKASESPSYTYPLKLLQGTSSIPLILYPNENHTPFQNLQKLQ
jgi:hypothetical protein